MKSKVGILSLGCPRNLVDSENILARLNLKSYPIVTIDQADIAIVNTCAFIEEAKRESIEAILDLINLKKEGRLKKIIVYGCLSQRYKKILSKELPEIDAFVGRVSLNHNLETYAITPRHYRYLKICESCINHCSFCVIPKIKGKFTSLPIETILDKVASFNQERVSELNIIGQDISGYGLDLYKKRKLPQLLKGILKSAKHIGWIRLLYLYPDLKLIDEILSLLQENPKVCKYIDLPLQHINARILKLMHRQTSRDDTLRIIELIRKKTPDVAIRTSLIVGFPSEGDEEFKELLDFITKVRFERLGAFIYSQEEGTKAYGFKNQIPEKIKNERFNLLMSLQQKISQEVNQKLLGKTIDVLIDGEDKDYYLGRSQYDAPEVDGSVFVYSQNKLNPGDFVRTRITDTLEYDLVGKTEDKR